MKSNEFNKKEVPPRYAEANIENIRQEISQIVKGACETKTMVHGMYIHGPVGVGKTYTAYALLNYIRDQKLPVHLIKSSRIVEATKRSYKDNPSDTDAEENYNLLNDIKKYTGLLIIDDIGSEKMTESSIAEYLSCIDHRYEWEYPTIYTSNLSLDELKMRVGDRLTSRIYESCNIFLLSSPSKRK